MTDITWSIFPKFLRHLSVPQLAQVVHDVGLDTTNLVIRDGYWVGRQTFYDDLPRFAREMEHYGLKVRFATAGFTVDEILGEPSLLTALSDQGIGEFRMTYFPLTANPRAALEMARRQLGEIANVCARCRIRAIYQVHHGFLASSASAAYMLVRDLPHEHVAIELDPGNQSFEGHENFIYAARLLGEYFVAAGIKDTALFPDKPDPAGRCGLRRDWAPAHEGTVDWFAFFRACRTVAFRGTFVFMPFYSDQQPCEQIVRLRQEVAYLRKVAQIVEQE